MDATHEMAQALRRAHCDRKGREHECVGEVTIKRGEVCLNCQVCGTGEHIPGWNSSADEALQRVFASAGINWDALTLDARVSAIREFVRIRKEWTE